MKKIALFLISASLLASCGTSNSIENKKKPTFISFELIGTIKVISNEEVYFNYKEVLFAFNHEKTRLDVKGEETVDRKTYHFVDGVDARGTIRFQMSAFDDSYEDYKDLSHFVLERLYIVGKEQTV